MIRIDRKEDTMDDQRPTRILIVDDDPGHLTTLKTIVRSWGYAIETADDGDTAAAMVKSTQVDLVLTDVRMARMSGIELLDRIKAYNPSIPVIIMTAYSSVASAVEALKAGAYDYLIKPLDFEVLKLAIQRACEHAGLKAENVLLKEQLRNELTTPNIIGTSKPMRELLELLAMVAPSEATVLITGESGTGKELIARSVHHNSPRKNQALVVVNCAAIAETLLESELFGHEKGAFTGADKRREGRFMQADGGTIFLDEIAETSPTMQAKLLRVLQQKEIQRVGGEQVIEVDVRIVAATNRDLETEVAEGRFREDLFYRINVMPLVVPPLRDRHDDIPLLAQHFLEHYAGKNRKSVKGFSPIAMDMLLKYEWPGNVRELENAIERAVILLTGDHITEKQLPLNIVRSYPGQDVAAPAVVPATDGTRSLEEIEKEAILATLEIAQGNKSETARRLGITRKTLHNKLKSYGLG
jgi:two-component system response regulator HydG